MGIGSLALACLVLAAVVVTGVAAAASAAKAAARERHALAEVKNNLLRTEAALARMERRLKEAKESSAERS